MHLNFNNIRRARNLGLITAALFFLSGCATVHEMGVTKNSTKLALDKKGLVLMSMEVSNQYKSDYQPHIIVANIETPDADSKKDRHNFKTDLEGTVASSVGSRYLMRMELDPGKYVVRGALCMYSSILLHGSCFLPIHADIEVKAGSVTYIGRVSGVMRERHGDEFRAGPLIPLVDQSVTGYSLSTFDVTISDQQEEDLKSYRELFPVLESADIAIEIMPPFDRARAQTWWESNGNSEKNKNKQNVGKEKQVSQAK